MKSTPGWTVYIEHKKLKSKITSVTLKQYCLGQHVAKKISNMKTFMGLVRLGSFHVMLRCNSLFKCNIFTSENPNHNQHPHITLTSWTSLHFRQQTVTSFVSYLKLGPSWLQNDNFTLKLILLIFNSIQSMLIWK